MAAAGQWLKCPACNFSLGSQGDAVKQADGTLIHKKCSKICEGCGKNVLIKEDALQHNGKLYHEICAPEGAEKVPHHPGWLKPGEAHTSFSSAPAASSSSLAKPSPATTPNADGNVGLARKPRPQHPNAPAQVNLF